jgi:hypothetical protein
MTTFNQAMALGMYGPRHKEVLEALLIYIEAKGRAHTATLELEAVRDKHMRERVQEKMAQSVLETLLEDVAKGGKLTPQANGATAEDDAAELQQLRKAYFRLAASFPPMCCGGSVKHEESCPRLAAIKGEGKAT